MKLWLRSAYFDIKGESTRRGYPAPYPQSLAERLMKLFSFAGDASELSRNSCGNERAAGDS